MQTGRPTSGFRATLMILSLALIIGVGGAWVLMRGLPALSLRFGFPRHAGAAPRVGRDHVAAPEMTNVVLFVIDTLRADRLNAYGYTRRRTSPNIDALAAEGVLFERAYAPAPWTLPSMASVMTARFPREHGVLSIKQRIAKSIDTLPVRLRRAGYATLGLYANSMVAPDFGFDRGYDFYQESFVNQAEQVRVARRRCPGRPFFLYVHNVEPHNPEHFAPPHTPGFRDVSREIRDQIAAYYKAYRLATWRDFYAGRTTGTPQAIAEQQEQMRNLVALKEDYSELYDAAVRIADTRLGDVIGELKAWGEWDHTLFILISDHGEELNEHGGWSHDQSVYEELIHVPLIIRFPGQRYAGERVPDLVSLVDLLPTTLDLLESPAPPAGVSGESLLPLIRGEAIRLSTALYIPGMRHNEMSRYGPFPIPRGDINVVVRRGAWKGIWHVDRDTFELYDLSADHGERQNVVLRNGELVSAMRDYARSWYASGAAQADEAAEAAETIDKTTLYNLRALGYLE